MNILRIRRKSKKKIKFKTLILFIFSLIMTTFAWYTYSKLLNTTLNIHMASWDMEYSINGQEKENPIGIEIPTLYPTMNEQTVTIDIKNNGEKLVDIVYNVQSVTIAGTSYELVYEGEEYTTENYIILTPTVTETDETTGKDVIRGEITTDITKFPFTIEVEHSPQVAAGGQGYLTVSVNWIGDNSELDSEWGYIVGEYLTNNPTATSVMSIVLSIDSYQADPDGETITEIMPSTSETTPYLPTGFSRVTGTSLETGLVIKDSSGNEYVWVEVPKNDTVYEQSTLNITEFTEEEYALIETDLKTYSSEYNTRNDTFTDFSAIGLSQSNYTLQKQKMLKSIYQNGGFYVGRYETGIEDSWRTTYYTTSDPSETPVIKANAYPYTYVTCKQAQTLAKNMESGDNTSSLMFGLQWDLMMKYLNTKGVEKSTITTDSTSWGNYKSNLYYITNRQAQYNLDTGSALAAAWSAAPYDKQDENTAILTTTGANSLFCKQNIYDLAGNVAEWTFNIIYDTTLSKYIGGNGGDYLGTGSNIAIYCGNYEATIGLRQVGFRVTIF